MGYGAVKTGADFCSAGAARAPHIRPMEILLLILIIAILIGAFTEGGGLEAVLSCLGCSVLMGMIAIAGLVVVLMAAAFFFGAAL